MAQKTIVLKESELKGCRIPLQRGDSYVIEVSRAGSIYFIEVGDTLLRFNSGVLLPVETAPGADGIVRPGLGVAAACIDYAAKNQDRKMLIAGHTDTVGDDTSNVRLSKIRAEAVHGVIAGKREQFANACWGPHLTDEQRYPDGGSGKKKGVLWDDYTDVLNWVAEQFGWPCGYPNGNSTLWAATVNFQKSYNKSDIGSSSDKPIPEYGSFDKETWGAVYDCYDKKLAELFGTDNAGLGELRGKVRWVNDAPEKHFVTCGEYKPIEGKGWDNHRSQTNRRVEIMFFEENEEPDAPCLTGTCDPSCCLLDNSNYIPLPVPAGPGLVVNPGNGIISLQILDLLTQDPIASHPYTITSRASASYTGMTDGEGKIQYPDVPSDLYTLNLTGITRSIDVLVLDPDTDYPQIRFI